MNILQSEPQQKSRLASSIEFQSNNYRSTGGELLKKITRSASEKLRRSGSITRTLINRSNLIKAQSNQTTAPTIDLKYQSPKPSVQQHRHSTDASTGSLTIDSGSIVGNDNQIIDKNNNLSLFKQPSSQQLVATNNNSVTNATVRSTHAQLKSVSSSPLPSTAHHRLHQSVYNQSSQPLASTIAYKSPPPPPNVTPVPNLILNHHLIQSQSQYIDSNEYTPNNCFINQNIGGSTAFQDHYDLNVNLNSMASQQTLPMQQMKTLSNQQPYITPKYVRSNFSNKKLPVIDCSKISSMNSLLHTQTNNQYPSSTAPFEQHPQSVKNPLTTFMSQKSPPSSGSSLETNSPRSAASQANVITTLNSSPSSSSPHPAHQVQSNFSTSAKTTNIIGNIGNQATAAQSTTTNLLNPLGAMGKVLSDLVSSDTRSATIQELRETVYRKVSTRFRSSSTSSSSTSSSCSLSNYPSIDTHNNNQHIYHPSNNLIQNVVHNPTPLQHQHSIQAMYHSSHEQAPIQQQLTETSTTRTGRQLPHIPGQQTYYQFHNQLSQQSQQHQILMTDNNQSLESSPSPKTPLNLQRGNQFKFVNALNSTNTTAFRFPSSNSIPQPNVASINTNAMVQQQPIQPPHSPLKNQSLDDYPCSSTTMSSHRSRSNSSDIYEEQPTSPITAHNAIYSSNISRHNTLQAANLRADPTVRNRRASPLRKQRAIHMIDTEQQSHLNQVNPNISPSIFKSENIASVKDEYLIIQQQGASMSASMSANCSPRHSNYSLPASSVKTQRSSNLSFPQAKLQQAKSFTMLEQPNNQSNHDKPQIDDEQIRWNWRENRLAASGGLFRCKSACETNTIPALNQNEEETVEPRTGCIFRKMTIKRKDTSYHTLDLNNAQPNQMRKLSFNSEILINEQQSSQLVSNNVHSPIANFFKEPVHKSHSEDSKANRQKNDAFLHNGSSGSDPLIHRKLGAFLPHISVSDYSANSRRPSAVDGDLDINETATLISNRFNSNNFLSSEASNTSTSRTSLHDQLSSSSSNTQSNMILSSAFDEQISPSNQHHLKQPTVTQRRNSSENKLNPNTVIYRQSRSLSNSAHSQEIEDQLLEKSFYSQPTLISKNASVDQMYPVLNNSKQNQSSLFAGKNTFGCFGEVLVSIYYNNLIQTLEIKVREARNLVPVDNKLSSMVLNQIIKSPSSSTTTSSANNTADSLQGKSINPYVKTYLMPDRSSQSKRKTLVKTDTRNPVFNDLLSYIVDSKDVHNRTLWLGVCHRDRFGLSVLLGELILSLDNINLNDSEYKWYPLKRNNSQSNKSLIDLHLKKSWPQIDNLKMLSTNHLIQ